MTTTGDWIAECLSVDRAHHRYTALVALADMVAEWIRVTRTLHAEEMRLPCASDRLGPLLELQDALEVALAKAVGS